MIKTTAMILEEINEYASPKTKLSRMVKQGKYIPVVRGLYETDGSVPGYLLAASIYGPSYLSFEYALSYHGLIPEAVRVFTCATFEKKKAKRYDTPFGVFTYRDVPSDAFPYGVELKKEGDYWYRLATPEKALCDKLYTMAPVSNAGDLGELLVQDLRIDEDALRNLDLRAITDLSEKYGSTNIRKLCTLLRRMQNE